MDIQRQFPHVHWIWGGGISFVYEVRPRIVVKIPKLGEFEREQFRKELEIYQIFSQHPPCPREHGPKVVDLLQNMEFPKLDGDLQIDGIIKKCWHNEYTMVVNWPCTHRHLPKDPIREPRLNHSPLPGGTEL